MLQISLSDDCPYSGAVYTSIKLNPPGNYISLFSISPPKYLITFLFILILGFKQFFEMAAK